MRTALLTAAVIVAASIAQAQSPTAKLPSQAELPASPLTAATPNAGIDEVAEQIVEIDRMLAQCRSERVAGRHIGSYRQHQVAHFGFVDTVRDNFE